MDEIVNFCVENGIVVDCCPYVALDGSKIVEMTFSRTDEDGTKYFTIKALIDLLDDPDCVNSIIKSICSEFKLYSQTYRDEIKKLQEQIDLLKEDIKHKDELLRKRKYELRAVHRTFADKINKLQKEVDILRQNYNRSSYREKCLNHALNLACDVIAKKGDKNAQGKPIRGTTHFRGYFLRLAFKKYPDNQKHKNNVRY